MRLTVNNDLVYAVGDNGEKRCLHELTNEEFKEFIDIAWPNADPKNDVDKIEAGIFNEYYNRVFVTPIKDLPTKWMVIPKHDQNLILMKIISYVGSYRGPRPKVSKVIYDAGPVLIDVCHVPLANEVVWQFYVFQ